MPNPNLDWIRKIAFDPKNARSLHLELAGLLNHYEFYNPLNNRNFSITGWGVSLNALLEVAPRLTLITTNYYSNGGRRLYFRRGSGFDHSSHRRSVSFALGLYRGRIGI